MRASKAGQRELMCGAAAAAELQTRSERLTYANGALDNHPS